MPGGYGGYQHIDPSIRRLAAEAVANVLANAPPSYGQGHAGDAMALQGNGGGRAKGRARGSFGGGGGKAARALDQGPCWKCLACGEPNNFPRRDACFKCRAPRGSKATGKSKGKGKGKERAGSVGKGLSDPPPQSLRPNGGRGQSGPIGADGKRPIFKYIEDEARERAAAGPPRCKGVGDGIEKADSDGFRVVSRLAGVWPRVGGTDVGGGKNDGTSAGKNGPKGGKASDGNGMETAQGKGSRAQEASPKGCGGKSGPLPTRPPWADQEDDDIDDYEHDETLFDDDPEAQHGQTCDEQMGDGLDDGDDDYWVDEETPEQEDEADHNDNDEQGAELEDLRQQWQYCKDVFEAVAWRYWKGQPQYEVARAQKEQAYERWQSAKKAQATPKLATLFQRRQRALDRARRKYEKTLQDADEKIRQHKERMGKHQEQMRLDQIRIDEAEASLQEVTLQVAASAENAREIDGDLPLSRAEARDQAAGARKGLESAQTQLRDLHDKLEEQGNFVACEQVNLLFGAIAGAAGDIEGVEHLLEKPRPRRQPQRAAAAPAAAAAAEYYEMDTGTNAVDAGGMADQPAPGAEGRSGSDRKTNPRTTAGTNRWDTRPKPQGGSDGAGEREAAPRQAAGSSEGRPMGHEGTASSAASVSTPAAPAAGNGDGAAPAVIRFGGASSEGQERDLLRGEAEQALDQALVKFQDADKSEDTDKAALLYAHQLVLTKIGVPTTLEQREAFERWRSELGESLERVAAERLKKGGAYW